MLTPLNNLPVGLLRKVSSSNSLTNNSMLKAILMLIQHGIMNSRKHIRNVNGLVFDSEELYWDGVRHEFYSHKFSKVVTPERTLQGTYFRSDEHMMHYEVTNSVGSFQSEDIENDNNSQQQPADAQKPDSTQPPTPVRPAATRRKATPKPIIP